MRWTLAVVGLSVIAGVCVGCRPSKGAPAIARDTATLSARRERLAANLHRSADSGARRGEPLARWVLPPGLSEISGLALTPDGRLLAHNDESGQVFEIDYRAGVVVKQFMLGKKVLREDFEGITVAGERTFMLASNGTIYELREGKDGDRVDFVVHDTKLGRECEFEGVAFDPASNSLIMACKNILLKGLKDFLVLYRWRLSDSSATAASQMKVPLSDVIGANQWKGFSPSDMAVDPHTGNYVVIASQQRGLATLTPLGTVVSSRPLPDRHPMAEGVAITRDSILVISDEASRSPATITLYRWP